MKVEEVAGDATDNGFEGTIAPLPERQILNRVIEAFEDGDFHITDQFRVDLIKWLKKVRLDNE